ncbi:MAG: hypothetical protein KA072_00470 [Thermoanaerobaculaceae bacterium]|nr:hypothetical protein [Thermoanaerobaculaceae bacterium]MDI9621274.1 hypothetical protein [Acidobacteriota bacterium]NLH11905.1 hypothetical protein [Holophagae bacterium]HPW54194.1 hypothetical protein [Thermoanaerobaculaceae bacterium]
MSEHSLVCPAGDRLVELGRLRRFPVGGRHRLALVGWSLTATEAVVGSIAPAAGQRELPLRVVGG